jgi:hypothetical protein
LDSKTERLGAQRERGRDSKRKKKWLPPKKKTEESKCRENGGKGPISKTMERDLQGRPKRRNPKSFKPGAEGCGKKRKEREIEKEKGWERKYNCLKSRKGIVNIKYEIILFILLSFLLKWRD